MPPVSKVEMLSMVDKWQEVEEKWAKDNDCSMPEVSAATLDMIRFLITKHFERLVESIKVAKVKPAPMLKMLVQSGYIRNCLVELADVLALPPMGNCHAQVDNLLDAVCEQQKLAVDTALAIARTRKERVIR